MAKNLFMTGSTEHYHQKGHLTEEEIEQAENNNGSSRNNGGGAVIFHDLESLVRNNANSNNNDNENENEGPPPPPQLTGLLRDATEGTASSATTTAGTHKKTSEKKEYPTPTTTISKPESTATFYDVEALVRDATAATEGDATTTSNNIGTTHKKNSKEQDKADDTSKVKTTTPPSAPTPPVFESLRDVHQSSNNNAGTDNIVSEHQKNSEEQNAHNPPSPPPTPPPTNFLTANPTVDIRRVNPAPDVTNGEGEECKASENGGYFGGSTGQGVGVRNGGVVLRYQYEVHESGSGAGGDYTRDILPKLEEAISNTLIPVFFEECLNSGGEERGRRWLMEKGMRLDPAQFGQSNNNMLRHNRRLTKVVGIDAKPVDIPLRQQGCESEFVASDLNQATVQCHRMEGALTLYFPPNSSVHSSTLSSTTLTMLRAIEEGMNDGSLQLSHPDIRKLHFAKDSYSDFPNVGGGGASDSNGVMEGNDPQGSNVGLILGLVIPLLVLCCCCLGFGLWKVLRRDGLNNNDDDDESSHVEMVMPEDKAFDDEEGDDDEDEYTDSSSDDYDDEEEEEDADSGSDYDEDGGNHGTAASELYDEMYTEEEGTARSQSQNQEQPSNRDWDFDDDYDDDYEEESEASYPAPATTATAANPLDPIFEEAEKERAKKRRARKQRNRVRRRMERMEEADNDDDDESFEGDASQ